MEHNAIVNPETLSDGRIDNDKPEHKGETMEHNAIIQQTGVFMFDAIMDKNAITQCEKIIARFPHCKELALLASGYFAEKASIAIQEQFLQFIAEYNKGIVPDDCNTIVEIAKERGWWPASFSSPLSIYQGLKKRKAGSETPKWIEKSDNDGTMFIHNTISGERIEKALYLMLLSICRNVGKALSRENVLKRDMRNSIIGYVNKISNGLLSYQPKAVKENQAALSVALDNWKEYKNVLTEAEQDSVKKALEAIPTIRKRKAGTDEQLKAQAERAEAEAAQAREARERAERAEAEARERAERAEAEALQAREAREQWKKEREALAEQSAKNHARMQENANKYNNLLVLLRKIPADCSSLKKKDMQEFLENIAKTIA